MVDFSRRPSHLGPDDEQIPLDVHLWDVHDRVGRLVPAGARTPTGNPLRELTETVALIHDFGKLTEWFRTHLLSCEDTSPDGPKHHAPLGAVLAHYVLSVKEFDGADPLLGFLAVAKHHGRLPDTAQYVERSAAASADSNLHRMFRVEVHEQAEHIDGEVPSLADELIDRATDGAGSWREFRHELEEAKRSGEYHEIAEHACGGLTLSAEPEQLPEGFYATVLRVWSALVLADKCSAAELSTGVDIGGDAFQSTPPHRSAVDDYVESIQDSNADADLDERTERMNESRESARQSIQIRAEAFAESSQQVATLTLPTGMGKTLSGLDAALTVLDEQRGDQGRLVYALPYTSIIDQVDEESREIFETTPGDDLLTVDHHLTETLVTPETSAEEVPDDDLESVATLLGESWRSGMVLTTFVQLFESLAGPANSRSMKLPSLYGSVVVLDEPQALPLAWWPLVDRLVELLTGEYNASVIAMTATQPKLLSENGRQPFSLVENPDPYYANLDRLDFELHASAEAMLPGWSEQDGEEQQTISYDAASELLTERVADGSSVLAICNTIDSARELAEEVSTRAALVNVNDAYSELLAESDGETEAVATDRTVERVRNLREDDEPLLIHLTTRHRPCDRRHLIDVAVELTEAGESVLFVSTQLVEAGVDVSFDEVVRDFAPMDSLVQAAGRCNRSFDRDRGRVTVWQLAPPGDRETTPASAVYARGESLTKLTGQALGTVYDGEPIPEPDVTREAVTAYFDALEERGVGTKEYVDYLERADAAELGALSLIDERPAVDVVVARTAAEWESISEIRDAYREFRWNELDDLVDATADQQVSVPVYPSDDETAEKLSACEPLFPDADRLVLDGRPNRNGGYFDATDGVVIPDTSAGARLL